MTAPAIPPPRRGFRHAFRLAVLVPLARLRFLFVLGAIGFVLVKWDVLTVRFEQYTHIGDSDSGADPDHEYFCPMHPTIVRDTNKEKCPICFMPLSKRKKGEVTDAPIPAGAVSRVQLTPYRVVLAGIRTVPVGYLPLTRDITTVGTVEFDERKVKVVSARVKGRIDELFVNQTGQWVKAGEPLARIYSPDLVVTVQNLLDAQAAKNPVLEGMGRERLRLWGIEKHQVDEITRTGRPITHLTITSPIGGHVLKKAVREGQTVEEGALLFEVADLSTVWVQAQLYETDLAFLPSGVHSPSSDTPAVNIPIAVTTRGRPGPPVERTVTFLFPHIDPETRTLTVRFELANKGHDWRPGQTATVTLKLTPDLLAGTPAGAVLKPRGMELLAVPESAVIDTGALKVVYRESLPNTFDGVKVELGGRMRRADGAVYYPVISGLAEGDRVAAAGSFLLDAETRLNPALRAPETSGSTGMGMGNPVAVRPSTPDDQDAKITAAFARIKSPQDRKLAQAQVWCPIQRDRLGTMDVPVKVTLKDGRILFVCCETCVPEAGRTDSAELFRRVEDLKQSRRFFPPPADPPATTPPLAPSASGLSPERLAKVRDGLAKLPPEDRKRAVAQRYCPVQDKPLGLMGKPFELAFGVGRSVFLCCKSCVDEANADRALMLRKVEDFKKRPPVVPEGQP